MRDGAVANDAFNSRCNGIVVRSCRGLLQQGGIEWFVQPGSDGDSLARGIFDAKIRYCKRYFLEQMRKYDEKMRWCNERADSL